MHIALDESYRKDAQTRFSEHELTFFTNSSVTVDYLASTLGSARVIGIRRPFPFFVDERCIELLGAVQFIHKSGTGVDDLDVDALSAHGILLGNNSGVNADSVADHIVMLTLICARNAYWHMQTMRDGLWEQLARTGQSELLTGKTVGIIGMGNIGCHVARRLSAFGMHIVAHQRDPRPELSILAGVDWLSLDDLLRVSDVVIPCVPLTRQTEGLISSREFGLMKQTALLINCSRGRIVDEQALYQALSARRIRAAGIDVFEVEPFPDRNPLRELDNAFCTPHVAGRAREVEGLQIQNALTSIAAFVSGQRPPRLVNAEILRLDTLRASHLSLLQ